jgi:glycosyltransferase involved in cell wall biosynthesis
MPSVINSSSTFEGRLGIQQRVLPTYRVAFFDHLAEACTDQMGLFAGSPRPDEGIHPAGGLKVGHYQHGRNLHLLRGSYYICWQPDLHSWVKGWNPDALIMEANPRYPASRGAIDWMHAHARPVLGWGLGSPAGRGILVKVREMFRRNFVKQFDALIAYSEQGADEYATLGYPRERIFVAANAVAPAPTSKTERPPLAGRTPQVVYVGRLQARKRLDLLIKACAQLEPAVELMIIGDGPQRSALESLAGQVFPQAEFSGALFDHELRRALERADLFVLPGTGGLAIQQAMAAGLPVIVAEGDGTQNDLVGQDNGWLIPPDDLGTLLATMRTALDDSVRLRKMGEASFQLAMNKFNIDSMRDQFLQALALAQEVV